MNTTTFRIWTQKVDLFPEVPKWGSSGAKILSSESISADGWDVTVASADANKFEEWLKSLEEQRRVTLYEKVET
jgi:hypothetical protein